MQARLADPALAEAERDEALRELERLELRESELTGRIASADPAWGQARQPRLAELGEVQRRLDADEALILLQLPPPRIASAWALVVGATSERVVRLAPFSIGSALPLYLGEIERRAEPPPEMAAAIEAALLGPVLDAVPIGVRKLVIVPDGPLARLPLAALPDPRTGRPLIERFELTLVPSATAWLALGPAGSAPLQAAAHGFGDVRKELPASPTDTQRAAGFPANPQALPRSRTEVRALVEAVGGASRAFYGSRASEAALKRLDLDGFGILHFATHAAVNALHPARSAILLAAGDPAEDGLLQPREIGALDLAGKLVVLSACRSADGPELHGEGPLGLAGFFLGSGTRAVLGTIWPVRDSETAALASRFYRHLARGEPAAAALAAAQRDLLAAGAPPAAWAGFVLIGDGDAALAPRAGSSRPALLTALGGALAVVLAAALVRRLRSS